MRLLRPGRILPVQQQVPACQQSGRAARSLDIGNINFGFMRCRTSRLTIHRRVA